jgi:UDP-glucose 4-epimerase
MKRNRVVITGANGFIGSFLVESLSPKYTVLAVCRKEATLPKEIRQVICDILVDPSPLETILRKDDIVVHLACSTFPAISEINPEKDIRENVIGSNNLLRICRERNVSKFVFLSSGGAVYGNGLTQKKETDPLLPQNTYGKIKAAIEKLVVASGLPYLILRPSNVYGRRVVRGNQLLGAVDVFLHRISNGEAVKILDDGKNTRDYLYIKDLGAFMLHSLGHLTGIYNVGTGVGLSLNEVVRMIEKVTDKRALTEYLPARNTDVRTNILDVSRALATGWAPRYSLEEGIRDTLKSWL